MDRISVHEISRESNSLEAVQKIAIRALMLGIIFSTAACFVAQHQQCLDEVLASSP